MNVEKNMQFEFVYGSTKAKFNQEVQKKIAGGWKSYGEVHITASGITSDDVEVPDFVYYSQSFIREN